MVEHKVELTKIRDFSETLNDTFLFIKQNLKPLLICFGGIAGIFMLASAVINGLYQSQAGTIFEKLFRGRIDANDGLTSNSIFSPTYFLVMILAWLNIVAMKTSVIAYVKVYDEKQGEKPTINEVWAVFGKYFLKVFLYTIPIALLIIFGTVCCIVPGVYLWVVLVPFEMVLIIEDQDFGGAWSRCFNIIKDNFWPSFGVYVVAYLIYAISGSIIGAVMSVITGAFTYFSTKNFGQAFGIATSVLNIFSFIFFIVWYIAAILNYFSLAEKRDGTGIMKRLNELGGDTIATNIEEQY